MNGLIKIWITLFLWVLDGLSILIKYTVSLIWLISIILFPVTTMCLIYEGVRYDFTGNIDRLDTIVLCMILQAVAVIGIRFENTHDIITNN